MNYIIWQRLDHSGWTNGHVLKTALMTFCGHVVPDVTTVAPPGSRLCDKCLKHGITIGAKMRSLRLDNIAEAEVRAAVAKFKARGGTIKHLPTVPTPEWNYVASLVETGTAAEGNGTARRRSG